MKLLSIVAPCYNEADNVMELYEKIISVLNNYREYSYEIIFIDNASEDNTVDILKSIANKDNNVKIIVNARNFGHVRSPFYGILQAKGDAIIIMASDLQDPPELLGEFIKKWSDGYKIVIGIKEKSEENKVFFYIRKFYYNLLDNVSELGLISNFTGFGLYDRKVVEIIKNMDEQYPYFRGLIAEIGFDRYEISYTQNKRKKGLSKNNFYSLYDVAMLGFVNHSRLPLRLAAFLGFISSVVSLLVGIFYFLYKLMYWEIFQVGMAPMIIGLFFFLSIQMFFLGVVGEYIGIIYLQTRKRPLVVEKERINFDGK